MKYATYAASFYALVLPVLASAHAGEDAAGYDGHHHMMGYWWDGGFGPGWITMLLVWILLILAIVALIKYMKK